MTFQIYKMHSAYSLLRPKDINMGHGNGSSLNKGDQHILVGKELTPSYQIQGDLAQFRCS